MSYLDDPRVYFAAERTLLAWIRTGVTIMGLGFVVAKFGIFLRMMAVHDDLPTHKTQISLFIGVAMVLLGTATCLMSAMQFRRFVGTLSAPEVPPRWLPSFAGWIAFCLSVIGLGLAVYLVV